MADITIRVRAAGEEVTARLTGWAGEELNASHLARIHETVDRALSVLRVKPTPKGTP